MKKYLVLMLTVALVITMATFVSAKGVYKIGIGEEPTTLNYWSAMGPGDATMYNYVVQDGFQAAVYGLAYPSYSVVPSLSADDPSEFVQEGDYYTSVVPLREDKTWTDGTPFTADDVVFTYSTLIDFDLQGNWATYHPESLVKVEKVNDYAVKFYFSEDPGLAEWTYGVLNCTIMPISQWGDVVEEAKDKADPAQHLYSHQIDEVVSINGFEFAKWEKGAFWQNSKADLTGDVLETKIYENGRHELTEGDWSWAGYGEAGSELKYTVEDGPFIDDVVYRLYTNQDAMIMALQKGDIDYMLSAQGLTKGFRQELEKDADVEVVANPSNGFRFLAFNQGRYPFEISEFNQAVATLVDRDYVMNQVLQGAAIPLATFVPPGNEYWHNPEVNVWGQGMSRAARVAQATELLEEAGFTWDVKPEVDIENDTYTPGAGIVMPNGKKMPGFDILTPPAGYDPLRATWGLWLQMWLQDVGVPARAKPTQFNVISDKVFSTGDFDAFVLGWGLGGIYPDFLNSFFATEGGFNVTGFSDPAFDLIMKKFMKAKNQEDARELAFKAQERLANSLPYIVLFSSPIYDAYRKDSIEFPTTEVLDGVQGFYGIPNSVKVVE